MAGIDVARLLLDHGLTPARYYYARRLVNEHASDADVMRLAHVNADQMAWITRDDPPEPDPQGALFA